MEKRRQLSKNICQWLVFRHTADGFLLQPKETGGARSNTIRETGRLKTLQGIKKRAVTRPQNISTSSIPLLHTASRSTHTPLSLPIISMHISALLLALIASASALSLPSDISNNNGIDIPPSDSPDEVNWSVASSNNDNLDSIAMDDLQDDDFPPTQFEDGDISVRSRASAAQVMFQNHLLTGMNDFRRMALGKGRSLKGDWGLLDIAARHAEKIASTRGCTFVDSREVKGDMHLTWYKKRSFDFTINLGTVVTNWSNQRRKIIHDKSQKFAGCAKATARMGDSADYCSVLLCISKP
ncbi:hypothetical protein HDU67_009503 [Dinochytrium kinnereticum]|nr:hypothetical protein HDU67_009503 [Dinochytrium kinnereticum]